MERKFYGTTLEIQGGVPDCSGGILYPAKIIFRNKEKIRAFRLGRESSVDKVLLHICGV